MRHRAVILSGLGALVCLGGLWLWRFHQPSSSSDRDSRAALRPVVRPPAPDGGPVAPASPEQPAAGAPERRSPGGQARPSAPGVLAVATPASLPEATSPGVISHWHGRFTTPLHTRAPGPEDDFHLPLRFDLPLDDQRHVPVVMQRYDVTGPTAGVFTGTVDGDPGSTVILSYVGAAESGVVHRPDQQRSYVITGDAEGHVRITTNDLTKAPGCNPPVPPGPTSNSNSLPPIAPTSP